MTRKIKKLIQKISSILVTGIDAKQVYLFGSYAYNTADNDSDIDIFVVADLRGKKKIEITQQARKLLIGNVSMPIDIVVCDEDEFNNKKNNQSTFEYIISTEGQKIYG